MKQQIMQTVKGTDVVSKSQQHEHKALKRKGPVPVKKYTSIFFHAGMKMKIQRACQNNNNIDIIIISSTIHQ